MLSEHETGTRIAKLTSRLAALERERAAIIADLAELRRQQETRQICRERSCQEPAQAAVTMKSSAAEKIAVFRGVFRGREDVFPRRWDNPKTGKSGYSPACDNEWISGICGKPKIKCGECPNQAFPAVSDAVISSHLRGKDVVSTRRSNEGFVAGVYPLLRNETCWFLAADFDKRDWQRDARAFLTTCREKGVPAVLERSRSGSGGHVWIFFSEPVPAAEARRLGSFLVTETMERCPDIGFNSYDRFFPSQDTVPAGGFGNLIALPLQNAARRNGNSVFVDDDFQPYEDQWAFLASVRRMTRNDDPTIIRHLHDLAGLETHVAASPAFARLARQAALTDTGRRGGRAPAPAAERFAMMLDRLQREEFWADEYDKFVRQVSFARPDEVIGFENALAASRRLVAEIGERE